MRGNSSLHPERTHDRLHGIVYHRIQERKTAVKFTSLIFILVLFSGHCFAGETRNVMFTGAINKTLKIHMQLSIQNETVTGAYFYDKNKVNIPLKGTLKDGDMELREFNAKGDVTGVFRSDHSSLLELQGNWSKPGGGKMLPFELTAEPVYDNGPSAGWAGKWTYTKSNQFDMSSVEIGNESADGFDFVLFAESGGNIGDLEGSAKVSGSEASWTDAETGCRVTMSLKNQELTLKTTQPCEQFCGMGAQFYNGAYAQVDAPAEMDLVELGVLENEAQEKALEKLTGNDYALFESCFQLIAEAEDLDHLGAKGVSGGVRGLFTEMEAIVLHREDGRLWAAVIDSDNGAVKYFTNDPAFANKLPKTIEEWRKNFSDKKVIFMNSNSK